MLELQDLACERGGRLLFRALSRRVTSGQVLRVRGPNGAGKTSLLRIVCGLLAPTEGAVLWRGQSVAARHPEVQAALAYIGHAHSLKDDLSPTENLAFAARLQGRAPEAAAVREALTRAGLGQCRHVPSRWLSQGQRRRASLARLALPQPPRLWILDEPFSALDADATLWLQDLLRAHLRQGGCAVLTCHQGVPIAGADEQEIAL